MPNITLPLQLAPQYLDQQILPGWQFSLFSIDLGQSSDPQAEEAIIAKVGSYGKQIGHLSEALEIVIEELELLDRPLAPEKLGALKIFLGDVAAARQHKFSKAGGRKAARRQGSAEISGKRTAPKPDREG